MTQFLLPNAAPPPPPTHFRSLFGLTFVVEFSFFIEKKKKKKKKRKSVRYSKTMCISVIAHRIRLLLLLLCITINTSCSRVSNVMKVFTSRCLHRAIIMNVPWMRDYWIQRQTGRVIGSERTVVAETKNHHRKTHVICISASRSRQCRDSNGRKISNCGGATATQHMTGCLPHFRCSGVARWFRSVQIFFPCLSKY